MKMTNSLVVPTDISLSLDDLIDADGIEFYHGQMPASIAAQTPEEQEKIVKQAYSLPSD